MGESVNNICTALYSLRSLFPSSISLGSSHQGSREGRLLTPSQGLGGPSSPPGQELRFAGHLPQGPPRAARTPFQQEANCFPCRGPSLPPMPGGAPGRCPGGGRSGRGSGEAVIPPGAVGCGGLERQLRQRVLVTVAM